MNIAQQMSDDFDEEELREYARVANGIERSIQEKDTVFGGYVYQCRTDAKAALGRLLAIEPTKTEEIRDLQSEILRWKHVLIWASRHLEMGKYSREALAEAPEDIDVTPPHAAKEEDEGYAEGNE